jgi:predicted amidohydrolase YtcJ
MPTPNLFPALQGMLEREDESLDLASALATMTINGAKVTRQAHLIGSIEKGKYATFIVLNQNLFKIPVSKIHETTVDKTVFEGRPVYEAN